MRKKNKLKQPNAGLYKKIQYVQNDIRKIDVALLDITTTLSRLLPQAPRSAESRPDPAPDLSAAHPKHR